MRKRAVSLALCLCMVLSLLPLPVLAVGKHPFTDVAATDWFNDSVEYVYEHNLMKGTSDTTFAPYRITQRGMIVTILHRLEGTPTATSGNPFTDVPRGSNYENAIIWAAANGIVNGYDNATFGPYDNITRQQMAAILYRYAQRKGYRTSTSANLGEYTDSVQIGDYARTAMAWANGEGLINGNGSKQLMPTGNATRAQAAAIFTRFCQNVVPQQTPPVSPPIEEPEKTTQTTPQPVTQTSYTVTFDLNYDDAGVYQTLSVIEGEKVTKPKNPTREKYSFLNWYTTATTGGQKFDFKSVITSDITLYARWSRKSSSSGGGGGSYTPSPVVTTSEYQVKFYSDAGTVLQSQTVKQGSYANQPEVTARDGFQFAGWFVNANESDLRNRFDFGNVPITNDISLHQIWVNLSLDSDDDGISDELEDYRGTDKTKADTDDDGLSDYEEIVLLGTDPTKPDTDGNGINDIDEDYDGDGLTNGEELHTYNTEPTVVDSDHDDLTDYDEINTYNTKPDETDTDGDGASDGWEIQNGFNPLEANSSFAVKQEAEEPSPEIPVTVGVEVQVGGQTAKSVNITPVSSAENPNLTPSIPGYLGPAYNFTADEEINNATITFRYDSSIGVLGEHFQPRIYYYNEENQTLEELPNQTVTQGQVSVQVPHFSCYILLNSVDYAAIWEEEIKAPITTGTGGNLSNIDVVFVVDVSGSMRNDRIATTKNALNAFLDALGDKDRAALVKFNSEAEMLVDLTSDFDSIKTHVAQLNADGNTAMYKGFSNGIDLLTKGDAEYGYKMIVLLSDGKDEPTTTFDAYYADLIEAAKANEITVFTVGIGSGVDTSILTRIASESAGSYHTANQSGEIIDAFEEIQEKTVDLTSDSNHDEIPDYYNDLIRDGKLVTSTGISFKGIDFNEKADYDGDGLTNGQELQIIQNGEKVYMIMKSNPLMEHSDMDGVSDATEVARGTNPLVYQTLSGNVNTLRDDDSFYYEMAIDSYESNWLFKADVAFLSIVFGVWNQDELYRDIMINYFSKYGEATYNEQLESEATRKYMIESLSDLLSWISDHWENPRGEFYNICELISRINGTYDPNAVNYLLIHTYKEVVEEITTIDPRAGTITFTSHQMSSETLRTINLTNVTAKINNVAKGLKIAISVVDVADTIQALSKVKASSEAFEKNIDILNRIIDSSGNKHAVKAANTIKSKLAGEFWGIYTDSIVRDGFDLAANFAPEIAALIVKRLGMSNVYVLAVVAVRDAFNLIFGISKDLEQQYQMMTYGCMAEAINSLLDSNLWYVSGNYYYVSDANMGNFKRLIANLAQVRILGELKYSEWQKDEGILGWFTDNSEVERKVNAQVDSVYTIVNSMNIKIASKSSLQS